MFSNVYRVFAGRPPATLTTGRTKELTPEVRENFITFAKSLGLTDDHIIFPVPIGNGPCRLSRPAAVTLPPGERGAEEGPGPLLSH